jgi:hypothetical protein
MWYMLKGLEGKIWSNKLNLFFINCKHFSYAMIIV